MYCKDVIGMQRRMILASGSPRRIELMKWICKEYDVITADVDETPLPQELPQELVRRLSFSKARKVFRQTQGPRVVIGADTVVALGSEILGKPVDADHAREMLQKLSGSHHKIYTGVAILWDDPCAQEQMGCVRFVEDPGVEFYPLSKEEIDQYVQTGEPFGKAGAYAIQMQGGLFVRRIEGDYNGIVGFPVSRIYHILRDKGLIDGFPMEQL